MVVPIKKKLPISAIDEDDIARHAGIVSVLSGIAGLFVLAPVFVSLAILSAVYALAKKRHLWGGAGLVLALAGFLMSPTLMRISGLREHMPAGFVAESYPQISGSEEGYEARKEQAVDAMDQAIGECRDKRLNGELKTYLDSAKCANPLIVEGFRNAQYPYMDLIDEFNAKRLELAEKIDKKELTEAQAEDANDQILAQLHGEALARETGKK